MASVTSRPCSGEKIIRAIRGMVTGKVSRRNRDMHGMVPWRNLDIYDMVWRYIGLNQKCKKLRNKYLKLKKSGNKKNSLFKNI